MTPIDIIAQVEGNGDDVYLTLPVGHDVAEDILVALDAAGYVVIKTDPELAARLLRDADEMDEIMGCPSQASADNRAAADLIGGQS